MSPQQCEQMRRLFFSVFGREMSEATFERRFKRSPMGYSYHGLILDDDKIAGSFTAIPYRYRYFGKKVVFALSVDTMIDSNYRGDKTRLPKMANLVYEMLLKDNIPFIYGFPNEYYYNHEKRILGTKDIGKLNYYILPRNIGAIFGKLRFLNVLSRISCSAFLKFPAMRPADKMAYNIEKIDDEVFQRHRYDDSYVSEQFSSGTKCLYKSYIEENNVKALYILDVSPLTPDAFREAVKYIYQEQAKSVDIVIYVGSLSFKPYGLVRVPDSMEPQNIRMTGKILNHDIVDESVFDLKNWAVNISNFDVR